MTYNVNNSSDMIKFDKKFYSLIRDGVKTQTLRLARKRLDVREGDIVTAIFPGIDEKLTIKIIKIGYKQLKSTNLEDALLEGYSGVDELRDDLRNFYPNITRFDRLYYYRFELL